MTRNIASPRNIAFFLISTFLIFLGFYRNQWGTVRDKKFTNFQRDSESLVMARMVETRQHGLFTYAGLMGWGDADIADLNEEDYTYQYDAYLKGRDFQTYDIYKSQIGFQSLVFSALDRVSPFSPNENLRLFRALTSLAFAITLSLFLILLLQNFGWLTSLLVLLAILASPWLALFGRNLFYFSAFFYLPMVITTHFLDRESRGTVISDGQLSWMVFALVALKCLLNGYDLIIPTLGMLATAFVQYAIQSNWGIEKFAKRAVLAGFSAAMGILVTLIILAIQIWLATGSLSDALGHITDSIGRRTFGDPNLYPLYAESLKVSVWSVLQIYLTGDTALGTLPLRFVDLIGVFAFFTASYFVLEHFYKDRIADVGRARALIGATWFSILSPIAWYVIFKGLAYIHTHTNFVAWYMPFMLFGFALCGYVIAIFVKASFRVPH